MSACETCDEETGHRQVEEVSDSESDSEELLPEKLEVGDDLLWCFRRWWDFLFCRWRLLDFATGTGMRVVECFLRERPVPLM